MDSLASTPSLAAFVVLAASFQFGHYLAKPLWDNPAWPKAVRNLAGGMFAALGNFIAFAKGQLWPAFLILAVVYAGLNFIRSEKSRCWMVREGIRYTFLAVFAHLMFTHFSIHIPAAIVKVVTVLGGAVFCVFAIGEIVGISASELASRNALQLSGLENGGMWIGRLERLLIYLFIFMNAPAGIGFLVAAKSVLRFSETREDQKLAEYVLIGTLLSFALAIAFALVVQRYLAAL